jgi:pantetheine-phosphate adenylyltransferase
MGDPSSHALYPGSFDVLTYGHLDLVHRAARIFDCVTVAVADNPAKEACLFSVNERVAMLTDACVDMANVTVDSFSCLTVQFARQIGATTIVRGLRVVSDFEFELQMAMINERLAPELTTVFMAPSPHHFVISSSSVKELAVFGGDVSSFVPPHVAEQLSKRLEKRK